MKQNYTNIDFDYDKFQYIESNIINNNTYNDLKKIQMSICMCHNVIYYMCSENLCEYIDQSLMELFG